MSGGGVQGWFVLPVTGITAVMIFRWVRRSLINIFFSFIQFVIVVDKSRHGKSSLRRMTLVRCMRPIWRRARDTLFLFTLATDLSNIRTLRSIIYILHLDSGNPRFFNIERTIIRWEFFFFFGGRYRIPIRKLSEYCIGFFPSTLLFIDCPRHLTKDSYNVQ